MNDVFISYKAEEIEEANWVKSILESNGISCWMAPASIPGGSNYAVEIPKAIRQSKVFVLILSARAQSSQWVSRELDLAINERKVVLPFMLENCALKDEFGFYLANVQRYTAYENRDIAIEKMLKEIKFLIHGQSQSTSQLTPQPQPQPQLQPQPQIRPQPQPRPISQPQPMPMPRPSVPPYMPVSVPQKSNKKKIPLIAIIVGVIVSLLLFSFIIGIMIGLDEDSGSSKTTDNNSVASATMTRDENAIAFYNAFCELSFEDADKYSLIKPAKVIEIFSQKNNAEASDFYAAYSKNLSETLGYEVEVNSVTKIYSTLVALAKESSNNDLGENQNVQSSVKSAEKLNLNDAQDRQTLINEIIRFCTFDLSDESEISDYINIGDITEAYKVYIIENGDSTDADSLYVVKYNGEWRVAANSLGVLFDWDVV